MTILIQLPKLVSQGRKCFNIHVSFQKKKGFLGNEENRVSSNSIAANSGDFERKITTEK